MDDIDQTQRIDLYIQDRIVLLGVELANAEAEIARQTTIASNIRGGIAELQFLAEKLEPAESDALKPVAEKIAEIGNWQGVRTHGFPPY